MATMISKYHPSTIGRRLWFIVGTIIMLFIGTSCQPESVEAHTKNVTITMNVDLKLPNITVSSLDTQLQEVELIGASLYNTELEAIETPQFIDLQYKLKTPTLWQKIEKSIAKLLHRNENR